VRVSKESPATQKVLGRQMFPTCIDERYRPFGSMYKGRGGTLMILSSWID
jgi:hypothetical protein